MPTKIYIDSRDLYIVRDVLLNGIVIHSDVSFSYIEADSLPTGISIDQTRRMLVGKYSDTFSGFFDVTIQIRNSYGSLSHVFTFILSCILFSFG